MRRISVRSRFDHRHSPLSPARRSENLVKVAKYILIIPQNILYLNNSHLLNKHFSTPKKQLLLKLAFPTHLWNSLINSIPTIWLDKIIQGNQNHFQPEEPPALPHYELPDQITKGDIYQYLADGRLQYYRFQDPLLENGIIVKDGRPRRPNTYDPTHPQGYIYPFLH